MSAMTPWRLIEPDVPNALRAYPRPLDALAAGEIPAIVLRGAYPLAMCQRLYEKLLAEGLLYDPALPVPERFLESGIPEGYYREGRAGTERRAWQERLASGKRRIDIGTSLGYRGSDPAAFFAHAEQTLRARIEQFTLPEVRYFLATFVPSFGLTLDELQR